MSIEILHDVSAAFGPARSQGSRPTCMAFAMSDLSRFHAQSPLLSAEYLYQSAAAKTPGWKPGDGTYTKYAIVAAADPGLPVEEVLPYKQFEPTLPLAVLPLPEDSIFFRTVMKGGNISSATAVETMLAQGSPVGLVIKLTPEFMRPKAGLVDFSPKVYSGQRHAVIATAVGMHKTSSERYIRIRNSWGVDWGDSGHAWLHSDYIDTHTVDAFRE
ncbi:MULTISPECIES: C1 family peptidase [Burkholderia cepacia complex]|uniref:C1 family peptidase n=1 Tax=Burkholderia cepacia complex TaxID=87882 RepID=UPI0009BFA4DF|nr:C1 family peptidase [Burkholderia vietnamiensis]